VLDPEIRAILDSLNAVRGPAPETVPIATMRAAHATETELFAGEGPDVAHVEDGTLDGPGGAIGIRTYRPDGARGTVAYFHGGGWVVGDCDSVDAVCRALALAARATVVNVDYRLAPEHPFPAAVDDALAAVRAVRADAVAGDSAGGNLAAVAAQRLRGELAYQALIYPVTDAALNTPSYREFGDEYGLTAAWMARYWELYLDGADGARPDASPLRAEDLAGVAPAYVLTADHDVLRDEGEAYAAALGRAGVPVTVDRVPGTVHGFWRWQAKSALARAAAGDVGAAIRAALAG
jgi:acetyl esterase